MGQQNSGQDLNFPDALKVKQIENAIKRKKWLLGLIVIASVLLAIYTIFTVKLIGPPLPGGFG